jgi:nucleotide-binding universal stress UspA family protein
MLKTSSAFPFEPYRREGEAMKAEPRANVLIGIDGSPASKAAARYGSALASALGDRAVLAFVNPPLEAMSADVVIPPTWSEDLRREAKVLLEEAAAACTWTWPPGHELADGPVAEMLTTLAKTKGAELLVVGRNGHGPVATAVIGSVADQLVQICDRPVLVLPHDDTRGPPEGDARLRLARILVGVDDSPQSRKALNFAVHLARHTKAQIIIANAVPPPAIPARVLPGYSWWEEAASAWGERLVRAEAKALAMPCETVVRFERPSIMLCALAEERDVDLIVVGHRGRGSIARLLLGSVADEVLRRARRPVIISH